MKDIRTPRPKQCQAMLPCDQRQIPSLHDHTSEHLLWQQSGWVAFDEMKFYMQMASNSYHGQFKSPIDLSHADHHALSSLLVRLLSEAGNSGEATFVPVFDQGHWYPVAAVPQPTDPTRFQVCAPPAQAALFARALHDILGDTGIDIASVPIPNHFFADCGFQTVGWIMSIACQDQQAHTVHDFQATHWRQLFHEHLKASDCHKILIRVGGMSALEELTQLVVEHGVAKDRGHACASHILDVLGQVAVQQILKSPQPWTDLKARTNLRKPPIRIVMVDELRAIIGERMRQQVPVGKKTNKTKSSKQVQHLRLKADQIEVPAGVLKQHDGQELSQFSQTQINANSRGILLANTDEAMPYFALHQPLSNEGIGLLVLDHTDHPLPHQHVTVRVPAICKATGDPLIATAALFQLGNKTVTRNMPDETVHIQESPRRVIRISVYKDHLPIAWDKVCQGPVRQVMETQCM